MRVRSPRFNRRRGAGRRRRRRSSRETRKGSRPPRVDACGRGSAAFGHARRSADARGVGPRGETRRPRAPRAATARCAGRGGSAPTCPCRPLPLSYPRTRFPHYRARRLPRRQQTSRSSTAWICSRGDTVATSSRCTRPRETSGSPLDVARPSAPSQVGWRGRGLIAGHDATMA